MLERVLHLLPGDPEGPTTTTPPPAACRRSGCTASAEGPLGFCAACQRRYDHATARRGWLVEALCTRLAQIGDPLFAAFGARRADFGAHVLAHLEELDAIELRVPETAVEDFVAELDSRAREAG